MNASLNEKLRTVKWGEFKLGELFKIDGTSSLNTDVLVPGNDYDYITRTSANQGILRSTGFIDSESINPAGTWSLGLLQMDFFFRKRSWYAGQFIRVETPKIDIPESSTPFFTTVLNLQKPALLPVLVRNVDRVFKNLKVYLPITDTGEINFEFMEGFIAELEGVRVAKLTKYLAKNEMNNFAFTDEDSLVLHCFEHLKWKPFRMGSLFEKVETKKLPSKANDLPTYIVGDYTLPCLTSSFKNQGLNYYAPKLGATILKNVISIPSNSDVYRAYYQPNDFTVLSDAYAIRWKHKDLRLLPAQYLFMVSCINKVTDLPLYSHKNKLGGWNIVKNKEILLPVKDDKPDFEIMIRLISAIKKMYIEDVVNYVNMKIHESAEYSI